MNNGKIKFGYSFVIIFIVLSIVLYFSLRNNYKEIVFAILHMNLWWIILGILLFCLSRICVGLAHYLVIYGNGEKVSFLRCLQISFIVLFFHGVTPFASGGQPMEVYFLKKEGISVAKATNITLQNFIVYQISLVLMGIFALMLNFMIGLFPNSHIIKDLVVLGFVVNFLVLFITFVVSFCKKFNRFLCSTGIKLLAKLHIIKDENLIRGKVRQYLNKFHNNALQLRKNSAIVVLILFIHIIGLFILYSIPYIVAKGLGANINLLYVIVATAYVMIIGSFVPIPGGTGGIEYGFMFFFGYFITGNLLNAIMLVWRFITYYLGMILGAVSLSFYRKKGKF